MMVAAEHPLAPAEESRQSGFALDESAPPPVQHQEVAREDVPAPNAVWLGFTYNPSLWGVIW